MVDTIHSVRQLAPAPAQQYFPLTPLQPPAPAPASPTVFFSHTIPAPASSSSLPNTLNLIWKEAGVAVQLDAAAYNVAIWSLLFYENSPNNFS